jgi:hypothetical protein
MGATRVENRPSGLDQTTMAVRQNQSVGKPRQRGDVISRGGGVVKKNAIKMIDFALDAEWLDSPSRRETRARAGPRWFQTCEEAE